MKSKVRKDPIVEEMRAAGDRIARACNYDIEKFAEHFMRLQRRHPERLVNFESADEQVSTTKQKPAKRKASAERQIRSN